MRKQLLRVFLVVVFKMCICVPHVGGDWVEKQLRAGPREFSLCSNFFFCCCFFLFFFLGYFLSFVVWFPCARVHARLCFHICIRIHTTKTTLLISIRKFAFAFQSIKDPGLVFFEKNRGPEHYTNKPCLPLLVSYPLPIHA